MKKFLRTISIIFESLCILGLLLFGALGFDLIGENSFTASFNFVIAVLCAVPPILIEVKRRKKKKNTENNIKSTPSVLPQKTVNSNQSPRLSEKASKLYIPYVGKAMAKPTTRASANSILESVNTYADILNKTTDPSTFCSCFKKLVDNLRSLIWANEKGNVVTFFSTPRKDLNNIYKNFSETIKDFAWRPYTDYLGLELDSKARNRLLLHLEKLLNHTEFLMLTKQSDIDYIKSLKQILENGELKEMYNEDFVKYAQFVLVQEKTGITDLQRQFCLGFPHADFVRQLLIKEGVLELCLGEYKVAITKRVWAEMRHGIGEHEYQVGKEPIFQKALFSDEIEISNYYKPKTEFQIISEIETAFFEFYKDVMKHMPPRTTANKMFDSLLKKVHSRDFPLVVQIRLEQLEEEYRCKLEKMLEFESVDMMNGSEFEDWCLWVLENNGFDNVKKTGKTGDQGVDITATKSDIHYAIQCKCYSSNLGNTPVQEIHAGKHMYDCQIGVVMTNRFFTQGATTLAGKTGVLLWDRNRIYDMYVSAKNN